MGSMEELEGRVSALEGQMRSVRQDAAAARVLAGGADRDVAALTTRMDAQTRLMQALRETQVEDHAAIFELKGDVGALKGGVHGLEQGQGNLEQGQANLEQRQANLEQGQANLARGQEIIIDLLRRRNGGSGPASAG
ncbi:hypothetical protein BJF90_37700 [Pseudonocardia sp. CNS-004]|nr:hypothetical protein BJF90_37700 [Pseudonocardia sp. CNS-004]